MKRAASGLVILLGLFLTACNNSTPNPSHSVLAQPNESAPMLPEERLAYTQKQAIAEVQDRMDSDSLFSGRVRVVNENGDVILRCQVPRSASGTAFEDMDETSAICHRALTTISRSQKAMTLLRNAGLENIRTDIVAYTFNSTKIHGPNSDQMSPE